MWNSHVKSQSAMIEKVQKAFSKLLKDLKNWSYHERLQISQQKSLEERRRLNDTIAVYKALHHVSSISLEDAYIKVSSSVKCGTNFFYKKIINIVSRHFFRVVNT